MVKGGTIISIFTILLMLIIIGVMIYLIHDENQKIQLCEGGESTFCPQWGCTTSGNLCGSSAIRSVSDTTYSCSYAPLQVFVRPSEDDDDE